MKRILILGCCGAGKSTFARSLSEITGLDIIHLDKEYWNPGWEETPKVVWEEKVINLVHEDSWIMDGNYGSSLHIRIPRADTIVYLNRNTITCLTRVIKRIWKYRGRVRPDMVEGCTERFDLDFLHYVAVFNYAFKKKIMKKINNALTDQSVHILKNEKDIHLFLQSITTQLKSNGPDIT